jgi:hypothetical protein
VRLLLQAVIFITCIVTTFIYGYNQALQDSAADMVYIDASITLVALKSLREKGEEETLTFLENNLASSIDINRNLVESRSIYFDYVNFQFPVNHDYYRHMLTYRYKYSLRNEVSPTVQNLNWLIMNVN